MHLACTPGERFGHGTTLVVTGMLGCEWMPGTTLLSGQDVLVSGTFAVVQYMYQVPVYSKTKCTRSPALTAFLSLWIHPSVP